MMGVHSNYNKHHSVILIGRYPLLANFVLTIITIVMSAARANEKRATRLMEIFESWVQKLVIYMGTYGTSIFYLFLTIAFTVT